MSVRNRFRHLRKLSKRLRGKATNNAGTLTENSRPSIEPQTLGMPGETILETRSGDIIDDSMGEIELDENGIGNQEEDLFYGAPDGFMSEREPSEPPDSPYSWIDVGTPLPSPPASPLELSDAEDWPKDEDGYENITAEDYRKYDRWYAEDSQQELDEMIAKTLTEREMDSIKMMAIQMFGHISQRNYERIRYLFREKIHLLTLAKLGTRVARLSGLKPKTLDCCVDSCHAFTLHYANKTHCSECKKPRYDSRGRPVQTFQYIPTIPRFQAFFNNPKLIKKLLYQHKYVQHNRAMDDFFDSELYKDLCTRNIIINGTDTGHRFFSGKHDIATTLLTDSVQIFDKDLEPSTL
ncbi:hypothetical protein FRC12_010412 [Ceratobasidium sp. 428]|nr:hypothetical protein FRC12_010412 [Ceratobasidium sp. 428]